MMYNMKYFNENAKKVDSEYSEIYDLDGHRYKAAKDVFVIMAETHSKACAMMIRDSYRCAYKKMGIATQAVMLEELPKHYIYAE